MKKQKLFAFVAAAVWLLLCAIPAFAVNGEEETLVILGDEGGPSRLDDQADLLTDEEEAVLLADLNEASQRLQFDMVVVTAAETDGKTSEEYADDYYDNNGFGFGADRDGVLLLVNMEEREWWISTCGYGTVVLDDDYIDQIGYDITPSMSDGEFLNAFELFVQYCEGALAPAEDADLYTDRPMLIAPAGSVPRLTDDADLLDDEEEALLLAKLDEVSQRQQFDVVIVTASTLDGQRSEEHTSELQSPQ